MKKKFLTTLSNDLNCKSEGWEKNMFAKCLKQPEPVVDLFLPVGLLDQVEVVQEHPTDRPEVEGHDSIPAVLHFKYKKLDHCN